MFEPVVIYSAEARYQDLLREAEAERRAREAIRLRRQRPSLALAIYLLGVWLWAR